MVKDVRSKEQSSGETLEEQDIDLRELRDFNRSLNRLLAEAMSDCPSLASDLQLYFDQVKQIYGGETTLNVDFVF